jgi:hypothetical protein
MLDRLLKDVTLLTLALGIALGWSIFRLASGFGQLVSTLLIDYPNADALLRGSRLSEPLTWSVGDRILTLGPVVRGATELAVVLALALFLRERVAREASRDTAPDAVDR